MSLINTQGASRLFTVVIIAASLISCSKSNRYVDKRIGYEIAGPAGWHMYKSDGGSVSFTKYGVKKYGNSSISVLIEKSKQGFNSPSEFLESVFLPGVMKQFGQELDGPSP